MAFVNIPPNLQDMFNGIYDRLSKLETGPNQPLYVAEAAQTSAAQGMAEAQAAYALGVQAQNEATQALIQAQAAYAIGSQSLIKSANTITNASNQITGINGNGITVYSGASSSSGARVVLNSAGLAGYNSSGTATFAIDASNGNVSTNGAIFTSSTISGGSLNINGQCTINSAGVLYANGATIIGTITSSAATITGGSLTVGANFQVTSAGVLTATSANISGSITSSSGTIGGFTIASTYLSGSGGFTLNSTGNIDGGNGNTIFYGYANIGGGTAGSERLIVTGNSNFNGTIIATGTITGQSSATFGSGGGWKYLDSSGVMRVPATFSNTVSTRAVYVNSAGDFGTQLSSQRYKHDIQDYAIDQNALLSLDLKAFKFNEDRDPEQLQQYGFIAEQAQELGLEPLIQYDEGGLVNYFAYEKLPVFLLQVIRNQEARIKLLEGN